MLRLNELQKVVELKGALGLPLNEGSCFGVRDPKELRPPFNLPETAAISKKKEGKNK